MTSSTDRLAALPTHILRHITGERRRKLVEYLMRWNECSAALAAIETWLLDQPQLATLRELRANILIDLDRAADALAILDSIDAERGMSVSRRTARIRALAALGDFAAAHTLILDRPDDPTAWRQRAELFRREGRMAEAATALAQAATLLPEGNEPTRALAELALAQGDASRAHRLLHQRIERTPDLAPATRDLQLLYEAARALNDAQIIRDAAAQLAERHASELHTLTAELGIERSAEPDDVAAPPTVALLELAQESSVSAAALAALHQHFGFSTLRAGQATVISRVLAGENVLGVLPTGAGKSLTYQLPAILLEGATLVISPLIALMKDQLDNLPPALAAQATTINSALDGNAVALRLRGIAEGRYRLVFVAPERLRQQPFVQALKRVGVARVVIDEAHCVSLWGMSFRPDYLFIRRVLNELGNPPVLGLTATATPETEAEIKVHLGELTTVRTSIFRPNLRFEVAHVANKSEKLTTTLDLCRTIDGPIVIYVRSRDGCEEVADYLRRSGVAAEHYHAHVQDRAEVQDRFMRGETRILVATVAFGMGVDKADVRAILHYNLPQSIEAYYQEAGRAGRDGMLARCVLFYTPTEKGQLTSWLREEAISKDYLREVFRALKQQINGRWGIVSFEALRRHLREDDETKMRVALGLLERVGLLERHFDLPRSAGVTLRTQADDALLTAFRSAALLIPGEPGEIDLIASATQLNITPDALERQLIEWHHQELLRYSGNGRDMLLELRPAATDVATRLDALLAEYAERQNQRVEAIATYARSARCRHRTIAEHFGEQFTNCGNACDICQPATSKGRADHAATSSGPTRYAELTARTAILSALNELPGQLGEKELVCVLLGVPGYPTCAAFGQLAGADFAATRGVIAGMIAIGQLAQRNRALVPVHGAALPAGPEFVRAAILRCLARLPFAVGKSGLAKVLKGASGSTIGPDRCADYAALAHLTGSAIEQAIEQLIVRGDLRRSEGRLPLLMLAEQAANELAAM